MYFEGRDWVLRAPTGMMTLFFDTTLAWAFGPFEIWVMTEEPAIATQSRILRLGEERNFV